MKSIKYTLAALAVIAMASFSTAKAQTANDGDVILGLFNSTSSLEVDLGQFSSLTNGETFNLHSLPGGVTSSGASTFDIVATGGGFGGGSGLGTDEILATGTKFPAVLPADLSTPTGLISNVEGGLTTAGSTTGTNYFAKTLLSSAALSFAHQYGSTQFGLGSTFTLGQAYTGLNSVGLFDLQEQNTTGVPESAVQLGTFSFSASGNDTILTYNTLATPEPSAYALGLTALALFWVLKRRSSTIA